jgi:hypothetical protein
MREVERTVSTVYSLLFVRRENKPAILSSVDDLEERVRRLEVHAQERAQRPSLAKSEPTSEAPKVMIGGKRGAR